jgi:hypothetical protein
MLRRAQPRMVRLTIDLLPNTRKTAPQELRRTLLLDCARLHTAMAAQREPAEAMKRGAVVQPRAGQLRRRPGATNARAREGPALPLRTTCA